MSSALQVEIKLRLPNKEAHAQVAELLKPSYKETHEQENFFFDGTNKEMTGAKLALRVRHHTQGARAAVRLDAVQHVLSSTQFRPHSSASSYT